MTICLEIYSKIPDWLDKGGRASSGLGIKKACSHGAGPSLSCGSYSVLLPELLHPLLGIRNHKLALSFQF